MHRLSKLGVALLLVAAVLAANPLYVGALTGPERVPTGYEATAMNATNPTDRTLLVNAYGRDVVLDADAVGHAYTDYDYRAPAATHDAIQRALRDGTATTTNASVAMDLRALDARYAYLEGAEGGPYYAMTVTGNESATTLRLDERNGTRVARAVLDNETVAWSSLSAAQRATVDEILASDGYYRPYRGEAVPETPLLVERNDTVYGVRATVSVDGSPVFGTSVALWGCAALALLLGSGLGVGGWYLERREQE
ncbi:hypothetical protein [Halarchaeum sp. P4]|uniref:hypothetical protein n=1 Tax=Halarchaeum sp. P4 TaxID=3421639 RepID=UPI003EBCD730